MATAAVDRRRLTGWEDDFRREGRGCEEDLRRVLSFLSLTDLADCWDDEEALEAVDWERVAEGVREVDLRMRGLPVDLRRLVVDCESDRD